MNLLFRKTIHAIVKTLNVLSGYRIWKKGEVPEITRPALTLEMLDNAERKATKGKVRIKFENGELWVPKGWFKDA